MPLSEQTEKALDWTFKIATALAIPAIVWSFKLSTEVAVLATKVENQQKEIEEIKGDIKAADETLNKIFFHITK
jgi:hypothetical protein